MPIFTLRVLLNDLFSYGLKRESLNFWSTGLKAMKHSENSQNWIYKNVKDVQKMILYILKVILKGLNTFFNKITHNS